jgi:hypothetical protein
VYFREARLANTCYLILNFLSMVSSFSLSPLPVEKILETTEILGFSEKIEPTYKMKSD